MSSGALSISYKSTLWTSLSWLFALCIALPSTAQAVQKSVAVVSFSNLTGSEEHAWVAEAFTSSIYKKLGYITDLRVLDRNILLSHKGVPDISNKEIQPQKAMAIASTTRIDYLIFGSVQASGILSNKNAPLRVHARFVDTTRGIIHKAVIVDGKLSDIYALEYKMTKTFLDQINIELSLAEINALKSVDTLQLEAYRYYNRGMIAQRKKNYKEAIELFEKAMRKHTGILYANAHHQLGQCYLKMGRNEELLIRFKKDCATFSPIYYDLGVAYMNSGKFDKACDAFNTFLKYNDNKAVLWKKSILSSDFSIASLDGCQYMILREQSDVSCLNVNSGSVVWKKDNLVKNPKNSTLTSRSYYIDDGKVIQKITLSTGDLTPTSTIPPELQRGGLSSDITIAISDTLVEVKEKSSGNVMWNYQAKKDEKVIGHNDNALLVRKGKHILKAVRIQKGETPTDVDALLSLAKCLSAEGKVKGAREIYTYIVEHIDADHSVAKEKLTK